MLKNMKSVLSEAQSNAYAIGSFNIYSYETIKGVLQSAQDLNSPVIIAFGERYLENMGFDSVSALVNAEARNLNVDAVLHLDHCKKMDNIYKAIRAGFTSVMYDGSALSYEDNIRNTKRVVEIAHACNVSVEGELGALAAGKDTNEGTETDKEMYTSVSEARTFVEKTDVDALAVSIGTVHGMYKGAPNIRIDILKEIRHSIDTPLVLHGGSGTPENIIKECILNGICKINVNTEISNYVVNSIKTLINGEERCHLSYISFKEIEYVKQIISKYIQIFKHQ